MRTIRSKASITFLPVLADVSITSIPSHFCFDASSAFSFVTAKGSGKSHLFPMIKVGGNVFLTVITSSYIS